MTRPRMPVPEPSVLLTVKLPEVLVLAGAHAREDQITISAVVTRALTEFGTGASRTAAGARSVRFPTSSVEPVDGLSPDLLVTQLATTTSRRAH